MGTPLPPKPPSHQCAACWGLGKAFGQVPTPRCITATLQGLQPGEFWDPADEQLLLTPHVLFQTQYPCTFEIRDARFQWHLEWRVARTVASVIRIHDNASAFQQGDEAPCVVVLVNFSDNPVDVISFSGHMSIIFGAKVG